MNKPRFQLKELVDLKYSENLELQYRGRLRELKNFIPVKDGESDLLRSMKLIAETGNGPQDQIPSAGCGIKWKYD